MFGNEDACPIMFSGIWQRLQKCIATLLVFLLLTCQKMMKNSEICGESNKIAQRTLAVYAKKIYGL
jgi:hypothetical protein